MSKSHGTINCIKPKLWAHDKKRVHVTMGGRIPSLGNKNIYIRAFADQTEEIDLTCVLLLNSKKNLSDTESPNFVHASCSLFGTIGGEMATKWDVQFITEYRCAAKWENSRNEFKII